MLNRKIVNLRSKQPWNDMIVRDTLAMVLGGHPGARTGGHPAVNLTYLPSHRRPVVVLKLPSSKLSVP